MSTRGRRQQDAKVRTTPQAVSAYFQAPQGATISTTGGTKTVATSTAPQDEPQGAIDRFRKRREGTKP